MSRSPDGDESLEVVVSTQLAERRQSVPEPASIGHGRAVLILVTSLGSLAFTAIAAFNDLRGFAAAAPPSLYGSLVLLGLFVVGVVLVLHAGWVGIEVPGHFLASLAVAAAALCVLTVPIAVRVATKDEAEEPVSIPSTHLDLRNQAIEDKSFAGQNLRRANFSGATLRHVDLGGTDLSEADLRKARLLDVNLSGVKFCGSDLRGADLRGARGLDSIIDWSYAFYDHQTRLPRSLRQILHTEAGPIPDTGRDLLYMCASNITRRIES